MDENKMGWREYARYAEMSVEELARDCEVQVFRATGPGGLFMQLKPQNSPYFTATY